jgi:ATP-dependent DNA helicase RecQ
LIYILQRISGCAIVYVRNRKRTHEIALALQNAGFTADFYHAGLNREEKTIRQNRWKNDECRVIVSTNAFGMGIDKADVRIVVHIDMPGSLEEYFQEAGRAGRDEQKAYAVALCSGIDSSKLKKRLADEFPDKDFICRVYDALGNYYQIAAGYGWETVHDFSLAEFCAVFHFPRLQAHHALKILELSGYIEYTEEIDNASRLLFKATRDELYKYLHQDRLTDEVIQVILRSYTGLFADYAYIDEKLIATRAQTTPQQVYDILTGLSRYRIVNYIPQKKTPLIIYTRAREEIRHVRILRSAYEERKERFENRISNVLEYMNEDNCCRNRMLLNYFGEKEANGCGICDVCLAKKDPGLSNYEYNSIRDLLTEKLFDGPKPVKDIIYILPFTQEKVFTAIRFLANEDEDFNLNDGYLSYTPPSSS